MYHRAPAMIHNVQHTASFGHTTGETVTIRVAVQTTNPLGHRFQERINSEVVRILNGVEPHGFTRLSYQPAELPDLIVAAPEANKASPEAPPSAIDPGITAPTLPTTDQVDRPRRKAADRVRE